VKSADKCDSPDIGAVALFAGWLTVDRPANNWQTMIFMILAFSQVGQAPAVAILTIALQLLMIYIPFPEQFFDVVPLSATDLLLAVVLGTVVFWAIEIEKWLSCRSDKQRP
jgi:P-type Ca2+ transporter type 2C